jgi:hypothetical protein
MLVEGEVKAGDGLLRVQPERPTRKVSWRLSRLMTSSVSRFKRNWEYSHFSSMAWAMRCSRVSRTPDSLRRTSFGLSWDRSFMRVPPGSVRCAGRSTPAGGKIESSNSLNFVQRWQAAYSPAAHSGCVSPYRIRCCRSTAPARRRHPGGTCPTCFARRRIARDGLSPSVTLRCRRCWITACTWGPIRPADFSSPSRVEARNASTFGGLCSRLTTASQSRDAF